MIRAVVIPAPGHAELVEIELGPPVPGEVVVRVEACGICATDLPTWTGSRALDRSATGRPGVAGHEIVGVVEATGERVVVEPMRATSCGRCDACAAGSAWLCAERRSLPVWGFADAMGVPARSLFAVPAGIEPAVASLTEPLACGVHALRDAHVTVAGARVAVLGAGTLGLLIVAAARHLGAAQVAVLARHPHQQRAAELLGADEVVTADGIDRLRSFRPTLVVEAVGAPETFVAAQALVAPGGEIRVLGVHDGPQPVDARRLLVREARLSFSVAYGVTGERHDFEVAIELLAANRDLARLVTHRFPLEQAAEAFATAADRASGALRVVLEPQAGGRAKVPV